MALFSKNALFKLWLKLSYNSFGEDIYMYKVVNVFSLFCEKGSGPFIFNTIESTETISPYFIPSFGWNWPSGSGKDFSEMTS